MQRKTIHMSSLAAAMGLMFTSPLSAQFTDRDYTGHLPLVVPSAAAAPQPVETPAAQPQQEQAKFTAAQLREMVGPIALYPDPLLAQVLAGSTYPLEIVQASRFVKTNANDPALKDKIATQPWDPSVQALAHYPTVLAMMDENLEWTQNLGAAFIYQQADVMAAIQESRALAQAAGNLATSKEQEVVVQDRIIQIVPADPQVIYVPVYEPEVVYVERRPNYYGNVISFGFGIAVGSWLDLDCDWNHHRIYHGGWYHRHHSHNYRHVDVHVHKDVHIHRDSDNDRHAWDRNGRGERNDRDYRNDRDQRDQGDRSDSVWRRNDAKPGPQVRQVASIPAVNRGDRDDRSVRDVRSDQTDRSQNGFRTIGGNVRPVQGVSRTVTPPVAPTLGDRSSPGDRSRPVVNEPQKVSNNDRTFPRVSGDEDRRDGRDGRSGNDDNDKPRLRPTPGDEVKVPAVRPPVNETSDRPAFRPTPGDEVKVPAVRPPVNESSDRPAFRPTPSVNQDRPIVNTPPQNTPRVIVPTERNETSDRSPGLRGDSKRETFSKPQVPVAVPRVEAPKPAPRIEVPKSAPRIETPRPAPRIEAPKPAPKIEVAPPAPRVNNSPGDRTTYKAPSKPSSSSDSGNSSPRSESKKRK